MPERWPTQPWADDPKADSGAGLGVLLTIEGSVDSWKARGHLQELVGPRSTVETL